MNSKMENSDKEKIDAEGVVEVVANIDREDGRVGIDKEVDVEENFSAEIESGTKVGERMSAEEVSEAKEEPVAAKSDGTILEEEADNNAVSDQTLVEKTEDLAASAASSSPVLSDLAPKKLEAAALPTSDANMEASSAVVPDSAPNENLPTNYSGWNQETSEIPRSTENQQFVAATPRIGTSWTNCCGLLDLLKHSNR